LKRLAFERSAEFDTLAIQLIKDVYKVLCKQEKVRYHLNTALLVEILQKDIKSRSDVTQFDLVEHRGANIIAFLFKKRPFGSLNDEMTFAIAESYLEANGKVLDNSKRSAIAKILKTYRNEPAEEIAGKIKRLIIS